MLPWAAATYTSCGMAGHVTGRPDRGLMVSSWLSTTTVLPMIKATSGGRRVSEAEGDQAE
jgi:hypothetical protein